MNTINKKSVKLAYCKPQLETIRLDNEISLILASDLSPDLEPLWSITQDPLMNNDITSFPL